MGRAISHWQAQQADLALSFYGQAIAAAPEWKNAHWVSALYSPLVERSVAAIQAEQQKRDRERQQRMER